MKSFCVNLKLCTWCWVGCRVEAGETGVNWGWVKFLGVVKFVGVCWGGLHWNWAPWKEGEACTDCCM